MEANGRLHIIVFEEIHKILTDRQYRQAFENFHVLNKVKTIIVGLSGSLPPQALESFIAFTKTTWRVIRTSSVRSELRQEIRRVKEKDMEATVANDASKRVESYSSKERLIIFCRTYAVSLRISSRLKLTPYSAQSPETNDAVMKDWLDGKNKIMVCTSVLGCGLDYSRVRDVIHVDVAYTMIDQYQQESRGGRDGATCTVTTYVDESRKKIPPPPADSNESIGRAEVYQWTFAKEQCLRIIPSLYLDGVSVTCLLIRDAELCSYCTQQLRGKPPLNPFRIPIDSLPTVSVPVDMPAINTQPDPTPPLSSLDAARLTSSSSSKRKSTDQPAITRPTKIARNSTENSSLYVTHNILLLTRLFTYSRNTVVKRKNYRPPAAAIICTRLHPRPVPLGNGAQPHSQAHRHLHALPMTRLFLKLLSRFPPPLLRLHPEIRQAC